MVSSTDTLKEWLEESLQKTMSEIMESKATETCSSSAAPGSDDNIIYDVQPRRIIVPQWHNLTAEISGLKMAAAGESSSQQGGIKREWECVMCLTEAKSVVFLPCSHQALCTDCNVLHERQGMKDCPVCRTPIMQRIQAHFVPPKV
nr:putative E3 ubiquitin-protein ligase RF298 [Ipomoea batatas]GME14291.1 putative E3 ubiquitin-protein ligase RF298 [Ipomoea batatas]